MNTDQKMMVLMGLVALIILITLGMGLAARKWEREAEIRQLRANMDRLRSAAERRRHQRKRASAS